MLARFDRHRSVPFAHKWSSTGLSRGTNSDRQTTGITCLAPGSLLGFGRGVLVVTVKGMERLGIRVDLRESRDRDSMEEAEVSRVLAEEVPEQARQTGTP